MSLCHKIDPRIKIQSSCVSFSLEYLLSLFPTVGPILILYCMVLEHTIISILLIIWLEVRNRAQKTLPKERPVHRLLYVIGYLLKREGKCFCPSLGLAAFFLHEKHLIYLLLINSTYDTCSSIVWAPFLRYSCK